MRGLGAKNNAHRRTLHLRKVVGAGKAMRFTKALARSIAMVACFCCGIMAVHLTAAAGFAVGGPVLALAVYLFFVSVFIAGLMVAAGHD